MKELSTRAISGALYISLLILCIYWQYALVVLFLGFGLICMGEFKKLIQLESLVPYIVFVVMYLGFSIWCIYSSPFSGFNEAIQIIQVITIFVIQYEAIHPHDLLFDKFVCFFDMYCQ
jgi:phosphatidate cytidylyltransferase